MAEYIPCRCESRLKIEEKRFSEILIPGVECGKAKVGDRFIKPDSETIYVVVRVVLGGDWVILEEEGGDRHFLTSREGLETWIKHEKDESA